MNIFFEKQLPIQIGSVQNLGKLFNKKFSSTEYCSILRHFLRDASETKIQPKKENKLLTSRRTVNQSSDNGRLNQSFMKTTMLQSQNRVLKLNNSSNISTFDKPRSQSTQKKRLQKILKPISVVSSRVTRQLKITAKIIQEKQFVCYSKKGRLLYPNKHSVIGDSNIFILCQGNGDKGDEVSAFISQFLLRSVKYLFSLEEYRNLKEENTHKLSQYFQQMFSSANYELTLTDIDIRRSGCTAIIVYIYKGIMIVVSAGDSNALLIGRNESKLLVEQKHQSVIPSLRSIKSLKKNKVSLQLNRKSKAKRIVDTQTFNGFGNIYYEKCICVPSTNIVDSKRHQYLVVGSKCLFTQMSQAQISQYILQNQDKKLLYRAKDIVQSICKRLKTISHQDVSSIFVKLTK